MKTTAYSIAFTVFYLCFLMVNAQTIKLKSIKNENHNWQLKLETLFKNYKIYNYETEGNYGSTTKAVQLSIPNLEVLEFSGGNISALKQTAKIYVRGHDSNKVYKTNDILHFVGTSKIKDQCILSVAKNFILGTFYNKGEKYYIEQLRNFVSGVSPGIVVLYKASDVHPGNESCATVKPAFKINESGIKNYKITSPNNGYRILNMALAVDYTSFNFHNQSIQETTQYLTSVFSLVQQLYTGQFNDDIKFNISEIIIFTSEQNNPWPSTNDIFQNLTNFSNWEGFNFKNEYDLSEYWFYTANFGGGTVGLSFIGDLCDFYGGNAIREYNKPINIMESLVAHEIGHSFNAVHDPSSAPYVMNPIVGNLSWSDLSKAAINKFLNDNNKTWCIFHQSLNISSDASTAVCEGSNITFTAKLGIPIGDIPSYQWHLNGKNIGSNSAQFSSSILHDGDLVSCRFTSQILGASSDINGNTVTVQIKNKPSKPTISSKTSLTFCDGGNATLSSTGNGSIQWFKDNMSLNDGNNFIYVATTSGNYSAQITSNDCTSDLSGQLNVAVMPIPPKPVITINGSSSFCNGNSVQLTSSSNKGNQWLLDGNQIVGATINSFKATKQGNYSIVVSDNGCSSPLSDAIVITEFSLPDTNISISGSLSFCIGEMVTLSAPNLNGNVYEWFHDSNLISDASLNSYVAHSSGIYEVKITSKDGCISKTSRSINVVPIPKEPVITKLRDSLYVNTSVNENLQWYLNDTLIIGANSNKYVPQQNGSYYVLASRNGCSIKSQLFNFQKDISSLPINNVSIYPNPVSGKMIIINTGLRTLKIELFDITGRLLGNWVLSTQQKEINIESFAKGMYFVRIIDLGNNNIIDFQIIKQ